MKTRFFATLILLAGLLGLCGQNTLTNHYDGDYGEVTRYVLVFSKSPQYAVQKKVSEKKVVVDVANCRAASGVALNKALKGNVLESISVQPSGNSLLITLNTDRSYYIETKLLAAGESKLVLDIFNSEKSSTHAQQLSYGRFFFQVGEYPRAEAEFEKAVKSNPGFTDPWYYLGMIRQKKGDKRAAAEAFGKVTRNASQYNAAQTEMKKYGSIAKQPTEAKPVEKPVVKPAPKPAEKVATKPEPAKPAVQEARVPSSTPDTPAAPGDTTTEPTDTTGVIADSLVYNEIFNNYKFAGNNDKQRIMAAYTAMVFGNRVTAVKLLSELLAKTPETSPSYKDINKALSDVYFHFNDVGKYKYYLARAEGRNPLEHESNSFFSQRIPLWIAILLAVLMGGVFFLLVVIFSHKPRPIDALVFSEQQIQEHENLLKKGYQAQDKTPEPAKSSKPTEEKKFIADILRASPQPEEPSYDNADLDLGGDVDPYKPPLVSEKLNREEQAELIREERRNLFQATRESLPEDLIQPQEQPGKKPASKRDLILNMARKGWDTEAIAKELQISVREVEFIIKMQ